MQAIARFLRETFLFIGSIVRPTVRSLRENSGLAALSVVLAFGVWILVTQAESSSGTRIVPEDITVEAIHTPDTIAVVQPLPAVQARVTVADYVFESLTAADFQATVDLQGLSVGDYDLPVQVVPLTTRGSLRVDAVRPETIHVSLRELHTSVAGRDRRCAGDAGFRLQHGQADRRRSNCAGERPHRPGRRKCRRLRRRSTWTV